jgi:arylsulfatase A
MPVTDITDENPGEPVGNGNGHGSYWDPIKDKAPFPPDNPKRMYSLMRDSAAFVKEHAGKQPFFMMVSHYAPHIPHLCTKEAFERNKKRWIEMGRDTDGIEMGRDTDGIEMGRDTDGIEKEKSAVNKDITYAAMVEEMDMNLVGILETLEAKGVLEGTYVIFTSDNGGGHSERREVDGEKRRFNGPLQEGKRSIQERGIRVPVIMAGPGVPANSQCDFPVAQWDYLPTMYSLAGSKTQLPNNLDGVDLRSVLNKGNAGKLAKRDTGLVFHFPAFYTVPITSCRDGDFKLMRHLNSGEIKLFDVAKDMGETKDLSKSMPEKKSGHGSKTGCLLEEGGSLDHGGSI